MDRFTTIHDLTKVASRGDILITTPTKVTADEALSYVNSGTPGYRLSVVEEVTDPENLNVISFSKTGSVKYMSLDHSKVASVKNCGGYLLLIRPPNAQESLAGIQKLAEREKMKGTDFAAAGLAGAAAGVPGGVHQYKTFGAVNEAIAGTNKATRSVYRKARKAAVDKMPPPGPKRTIIEKILGKKLDNIRSKFPKELPKNRSIPEIAKKTMQVKSLKAGLLWGTPAALGTLGVLALTKRKKEKTAALAAPTRWRHTDGSIRVGQKPKGEKGWSPATAADAADFKTLRQKLRTRDAKKKEKTAADRAPGKGPQKWETDPTPALEPLTWLSRFRKKLREYSLKKRAERNRKLNQYRLRQ